MFIHDILESVLKIFFLWSKRCIDLVQQDISRFCTKKIGSYTCKNIHSLNTKVKLYDIFKRSDHFDPSPDILAIFFNMLSRVILQTNINKIETCMHVFYQEPIKIYKNYFFIYK